MLTPGPQRCAIIAHRGASGRMPEHTLEGYALALEQGADVIEPDLVPCADGTLYCRHEAALSRSTDIALRVDFSGLARDREWSITDLEPAQVDRLRALQPFPGRPREFDRHFRIPDFRSLLRWAGTAARQRGQRVRLYPELKQPARFAALGLDPVPAFLDALEACPPEVDIWLQCFEPDALRRVGERRDLPLFLLLDAGADWRAAIATAASGLAESTLAEPRFAGFGVHKSLLWDGARPSGLIDAAHAERLAVHAWTYRDDRIDADPFRAFGSIGQELSATFQLGVDGVFCDFPATAVAVRNRLQ